MVDVTNLTVEASLLFMYVRKIKLFFKERKNLQKLQFIKFCPKYLFQLLFLKTL